MKRLTVLVLIHCLVGCTMLRPVTGNLSELQQRIASGEVLKRGDHVVILTKDGRTQEFKVVSVSDRSIDGKHELIPIDQVASVQKRELNVGKTALVVGLIVVGVGLIVVLAIGLRGVAATEILNSSP